MKSNFSNQQYIKAFLGAATVAVVSYFFYKSIRNNLTKTTVSIIKDIDISSKFQTPTQAYCLVSISLFGGSLIISDQLSMISSRNLNEINRVLALSKALASINDEGEQNLISII